jgi:dihydrofolate synthase/folylpolyglutamate synthase
MLTFKSYNAVLEYIYAKLPMFQRQGPSAYKKDLTNTILLCAAAGNPQDKIKSIHIAGTNGKGTTTHLIAGGLQAQGYKVGVYTSPHYKDFRERIKINGVYISKKFIKSFVEKYYDEIEEIQPSFFEVTVALAFAYFEAEKVDYAIIETGLGGRLDSTNVIMPLLSVITNISYDHQNLLGETLQEIAGEKAGIIKSNIPIIIGEKQSEVEDVFVNKAKSVGAPLSFAEENIQLSLLKETPSTKTYQVTYQGKTWIKALETTLIGPFQEKNIRTAMASLHHLSKHIKIDADKISSFFPDLVSATGYMGRWQIMSSKPLIIADSAHNEGGLKYVIQALGNIPKSNLHIVMGFVNDKDLGKVLALFPKNATYYFAKANIPRGLDATILKEQAQGLNLHGKSYSSVKKAFAAAKMSAKDNDLIFVGGSIFVVAEVI